MKHEYSTTQFRGSEEDLVRVINEYENTGWELLNIQLLDSVSKIAYDSGYNYFLAFQRSLNNLRRQDPL